MKIQVKGDVYSLNDTQPRIREIVMRETQNILVTWKRTVDGIIEIGRSLEKIKELLPFELFKIHVKEKLGLNDMQASRLINVYRKFGNATSSKVLSAKPSVLYLLATAQNLEKVERLASGGSVLIEGKRKTIDQLRVEDALKLRKVTPKKSKELSPAEMDKQRALTAFEILGDLAQQLSDWASDLHRYNNSGLKIPNRKFLLDTLKESNVAVLDCIKVLQ